jgi:WD40 repeat protein
MLGLKSKELTLLAIVLALGMLITTVLAIQFSRDVNKVQSAYELKEAEYLTEIALGDQKLVESQGQILANETQLVEAEAQLTESQRHLGVVLSRHLVEEATAHFDQEMDLSLLLSVEAYRMAPTDDGLKSLLDGIQNASPYLDGMLFRHKSTIADLVFTPDGETLLSVSEDGLLLTWDLSTRRPIRQFVLGYSYRSFHVFSSDGKFLASLSPRGDNRVSVWDVETGQLIDTLARQADSPIEVVNGMFIPGAKSLLVIYSNGKSQLWHFDSGVVEESVTSEDGTAFLAVSPDGKLVAVRGSEGSILVLDLTTKQIVSSLAVSDSPDPVIDAAFSPDNKTLVSTIGKKVNVWDIATQSWLVSPSDQMWPPMARGFEEIAFSPDGKFLMVAMTDNAIVTWDYPICAYACDGIVSKFMSGHTSLTQKIIFTPNSLVAASGSENGEILLWTPASLRAFNRNIELSGEFVNIEGSGGLTGSEFFVTTDESNINFLSVENLSPVQPSVKYSGVSRTIAVSINTDKAIQAWSRKDHIVVIHDNNYQQTIEIDTGVLEDIKMLAISPDGRILATGNCEALNEQGCIENGIRFWDIQGRGLIDEPIIYSGSSMTDLVFSDDGKWLAASDKLGSIHVWEVETQSLVAGPLEHHSMPGVISDVRNLSFSPDGKFLASASGNESTILWETSTWQPIGEPVPGQHAIFSPDSNMLITATKEIMIWDVRTLREMGHFPMAAFQNYPMTTMSFNSTGTILASSGSYKTIMLWNFDSESWVEIACRIASRNFTTSEWTHYFGNEPYRKTCDQWPENN